MFRSLNRHGQGIPLSLGLSAVSWFYIVVFDSLEALIGEYCKYADKR
jgi:hypothetical protein